MHASLEKVILRKRDDYAPMEKKILRANKYSFMKKAFPKAIIFCSRMETGIYIIKLT